jgi:hypothetical protein
MIVKCTNNVLYQITLKVLSSGSELLTKGEGLVHLTSLYVTNMDQLILILKILFTFITKQATFTRRSTVLRLPLKLVFLASGVCITAVIDTAPWSASWFVSVNHTHPSLIFVGKDWAYNCRCTLGLHSKVRLLSFPTNIRLGRKWLTVIYRHLTLLRY